MAINAFSNLSISVSDGGTVPSLDYLSVKTYISIGSGNVLKVSWNTPTATNNAVDTYKVYILNYDTDSSSYKSLYSANVGNVNEFYLKASVLNSLQKPFMQLRIYVEAISKYGSAYNGVSNTASVNVSKGCGTYIKVTEGFTQPVMKRAVAFAKLAYSKLLAISDTSLVDTDGNTLASRLSSVQDVSTGWTPMQEFYTRGAGELAMFDSLGRTVADANGIAIYLDAPEWPKSDISFEVLTDASGEVITDMNNDSIYVL